MLNKSIIIATLSVMVMAGCDMPHSEEPLATNFPTTKQPKLQAASHWNVIASDVAKRMAGRVEPKRALYVNQSSAKTPFDRAFSTQLISALVAEGFVVNKTAQGALSVDIDTQAVRFTANRPQYKHAGTATALTAGVWALRQGDATGAAALAAAIVTADAYTWFRSEFATGETPQTEIIVTTSISDSSKYIARDTNVYYVSDSDSLLYEYTPPVQVITREIGVTGK